MIKVDHLSKSYYLGELTLSVLHDISFTIQPGELVAIMGPSGCGKSTLMNILGLLDHPSEGHYFLDGRDVSQLNDEEAANARNHLIGFVFQQFNLLSRATALDNVSLPLRYRGMQKKHIEERAKAILDRVGMGHHMHHKPHQLSGGQQQRVAIARALVGHPKMILADEPTGALDSHIGQEVMRLFIERNREDHITTVLITHDPHVAAQCDRTIHLKDGRIAKDDRHGMA